MQVVEEETLFRQPNQKIDDTITLGHLKHIQDRSNYSSGTGQDHPIQSNNILLMSTMSHIHVKCTHTFSQLELQKPLGKARGCFLGSCFHPYC